MADPRPYVLAETNYKYVKGQEFELVILPWGATEAHNYHMPYATDNILGENVAIESARIAFEKGAKVMVLPTIPFGVNTGQSDIEFCINMHPSTQLSVLRDVVQTLDQQGVPKLVILNAHGGNHFKQMIRELYTDYPEVFICCVDWWKVGPADEIFDAPGDHAGELETSVVMHLNPEWVLPLEMAGDGAARDFSVKGLREGWTYTQRKWSEVTKDTGVGDPRNSTADKGEKFFEEATRQVGDFLYELAQTPNSKLYS